MKLVKWLAKIAYPIFVILITLFVILLTIIFIIKLRSFQFAY